MSFLLRKKILGIIENNYVFKCRPCTLNQILYNREYTKTGKHSWASLNENLAAEER